MKAGSGVDLDTLLARMTLREKVGQLNQRMFGWDAVRKTGGDIELTDAFRREVERWGGMGALYGLSRADPWSGRTCETGLNPEESARAANLVQCYVREHTRLGIPVLLSEECPHGHQALEGTLLPTGIGVASTWNPEAYERAMAGVARELRARGAHLGLVANLDLCRDPRWGRTEETLGEDPYLAARMAEAAVFGLQGRSEADLRGGDRIAAVSKHFTAHGASEGGRNLGASAIGERELREIHLPPAEAAARAGTAAFMACYNEIDGVPCHANEALLSGILRGEWGFDGMVMGDGTAVDRLLMQTGRATAAAALALNAGVDLSLWDDAFTRIEEAVQEGLIPEARVDRAVRRVLAVKARLGLFTHPLVDESRAAAVVGGAETRSASLALAREGLVLLKNADGLLPLRTNLHRIAVIGPNADHLYHQLGDYTPPQRPGAGITVLQGVRATWPEAGVRYVRGCGVRDPSTAGIAEAVEAARASEVVVLVLGGSSARNFDLTFDANGAARCGPDPTDMDGGEGVDVADLELGGAQVELARSVIAAGVPVVVVLIQGRPHAIPWIAEHAAAVLCAWYPGPWGGRAVAEVLRGDVNPSGRLPVTVPKSAAMLPVYYNRKETGRKLAYRDAEGVQYPFGFGLSYTTFTFSNLRGVARGDSVEVDVEVTNTGRRAGSEVVQLYVKDLESSVTRRVQELKAFRKVHLQPGETQRIAFTLGPRDLAVWTVDRRYAVEPGGLRIMVGGGLGTSIECCVLVGAAS